MCIKRIKSSIKIIEEYNEATGSDSFYSFIQFAFAILPLIAGFLFKSYKLFFYSLALIISGVYAYFQPLIIYRYPRVRIINGFATFIGVPVASFLIGVSFCNVYFLELSDKASMIMYATSAIITSVLFCSIYIKDAIEHIIKLSEKKSNIFFLLLEVYQVIHFFALMYAVVLIFNHSGFSGVDTTSAFSIYLDMFYFSTITFTTLGYGDIVPTNPIAKMIVIVEVFLFVIVISLAVVNISKKEIRRDDVGEKVD